MSSIELSPTYWSKILEFLRSQPDLYVGKETECKLFVEAVVWIARSGAQWRLLPCVYGKWNSVYKRFVPRCRIGGIWERPDSIGVVDDPDMEHLVIDSTVIRVHPCAAGAPPKTVVKHHKSLVGAEVGSAQKST